MALVLSVLGMIVILVAIDAVFRIDERRAARPREVIPERSKIVVDTSVRERD